MGILFLVATPIGNLEDLTPRARRVLGEVALVAAEDTRRTRQLLNHFDLHPRLTSYWEHNKLSKLDEILNALETGNVALVSDAGTPNLSDPGYELVRAALAAGHEVTPIPGPSALIAALVASGLPTDAFVYLGFLPRKPTERRGLLASVAEERRTLVAFESPNRLLDTLTDIEAELGDRAVAVARELTKLHEEIFRGAASAARQHFASKEILGEITVVVAGSAPAAASWPPEQVQAELARRIAAGQRLKDAARAVAGSAGWKVRNVYDMAVRHSDSAVESDELPPEAPPT